MPDTLNQADQATSECADCRDWRAIAERLALDLSRARGHHDDRAIRYQYGIPHREEVT